jgi:hypothetical protein
MFQGGKDVTNSCNCVTSECEGDCNFVVKLFNLT